MINPATQNFLSPAAAQLAQLLFDEVYPRTVGTNNYLTLVGTINQLALLFPNDRNAFAALLSARTATSSGRVAQAVPVEQLYQQRPVTLQKNPDCPTCPAVEVYADALPLVGVVDMGEAKEVKLPPELLEPVTPAPAYKKPQSEMTFMDGETVEEVLQAHGLNHYPENELRERLILTLTQVLGSNAEWDNEMTTNELAAAILKGGKDIEAPKEDVQKEIVKRGRPASKK